MSGTLWPCADISTTIARRSRTGSRAVRPIRRRRCPSAIVTGRTNTSGGRPMATSSNTTPEHAATGRGMRTVPSAIGNRDFWDRRTDASGQVIA